MNPNSNGSTLSEDELKEFVAKYEVQTNAAIRRLLAVNDQYGNAVIRSAVFDELNGLMRTTRKCLLLTKDSAPTSQSSLRV